jgi:hypothetical protein
MIKKGRDFHWSKAVSSEPFQQETLVFSKTERFQTNHETLISPPAILHRQDRIHCQRRHDI